MNSHSRKAEPAYRSVLTKILWCVGVPALVVAGYLVAGVGVVASLQAEPVLATVVLGGLTIMIVMTLRVLRPRWFRYEPVPEPIAQRGRYIAMVGLALALAFLAGQCLALSLYAAFGSQGFDQTGRSREAAAPALTMLLVLVIAPLSEESLFRGLIYPLLRRRVGVLLAAVTTSAVFALVHANLVQFAVALPMSLLMSLIYERTRRLWPVIAAHMLFNMAALLVPPAWLALVINPVSVTLLMAAFGVCAWKLYAQTSPGRVSPTTDKMLTSQHERTTREFHEAVRQELADHRSHDHRRAGPGDAHVDTGGQ